MGLRSVVVLSLALAAGAATSPALAQPGCQSGPTRVGVVPPPPLPQYAQPPIPGYGYVWTPGYWAWNGGMNDYDWVPGLWVQPPQIGFLWTPPWWGWDGGFYLFHDGYWGPTVGFYGGIDYGWGYGGHGYDGGYWQGRTFYYNRQVNNFGRARFNAIYDRPVSGGRYPGHASYNGGVGGVAARPTPAEAAAEHGAHIGATRAQAEHFRVAGQDSSLRAGVNRGHPAAAVAEGLGARGVADRAPEAGGGFEGVRAAEGRGRGEPVHAEAEHRGVTHAERGVAERGERRAEPRGFGAERSERFAPAREAPREARGEGFARPAEPRGGGRAEAPRPPPEHGGGEHHPR